MTSRNVLFETLHLQKIALGTGTAFLGMLILTAVAAWLVSEGIIGEEWTGYLSFLAIFFPAFLGSRVASGGFMFDPDALLTGVGFWLLLMVVRVLMFDGSIFGIFPVAAGVVAGTGCALLLRRPERIRGSRRKKRRRR